MEAAIFSSADSHSDEAARLLYLRVQIKVTASVGHDQHFCEFNIPSFPFAQCSESPQLWLYELVR